MANLPKCDNLSRAFIHMQHFTYQGKNVLNLPARQEELIVLRNWIESVADTICASTQNKRQLFIAVDEIFTNIASYSYNPEVGDAQVSTDFDEEKRQLIITFTDKGKAYNPLEADTPDIDAALDDRSIGGLGIFMVRQLMDDVEYKRENEQNILILKKTINTNN